LLTLEPAPRHLLIPYHTTLQVYSTEDSLLVRRIAIPIGTSHRIVAMRQSRVDPDFVWVACSHGTIYRVDWASSTSGHHSHHRERPPYIRTETGTCTAMTLVEMSLGGKPEDVLVVAERIRGPGSHPMLVAYKGTVKTNQGASATLLTMKGSAGRSHHEIGLLEASQDGLVIVGAADDRICVTSLQGLSGSMREWQQCQSYMFDAGGERVTALDVRMSGKQNNRVDVIVGNRVGRVYCFGDVLAMLATRPEEMVPKQLHWHARGVRALKWSRDGECTELEELPISHPFP
jgi:NET1-associated nuclear protein 1 (U3 small nucleolar RNA-associated protein 17)